MANNELSGPIVSMGLINYFRNKKLNKTLRFIFIPETIGSISYLSKNIKYLKENAIGKIRDILQSKTSKKTNKRLRPLQLQIYLKTFRLRKEKKKLLEVAKLLRQQRLNIMKTHKDRALMKEYRTLNFFPKEMTYFTKQRIIVRFNTNAKRILQNVCKGTFPGQYTS